MSSSNNQTIQDLMNQVDKLDANDNSLEAKLQLIAQKVAEEQQKMKAMLTGNNNRLASDINVDPADAFACEGCQ